MTTIKTMSLLLGFVFVNFCQAAAPLLLIETTLTEQLPQGAPQILAAPRIVVVSGQNATVRSGDIELNFTPTLQNDGSVDLQMAINKYMPNNQVVTLSRPRLITKMGQSSQIQVGQWTVDVMAKAAEQPK